MPTLWAPCPAKRIAVLLISGGTKHPNGTNAKCNSSPAFDRDQAKRNNGGHARFSENGPGAAGSPGISGCGGERTGARVHAAGKGFARGAGGGGGWQPWNFQFAADRRRSFERINWSWSKAFYCASHGKSW